ncbi:MAG: hypothetical protein B1H13_11835 [Desulfobacteraceae bacterium 4484_190.3]|nr:MAG: hypothetical protein B1H13_11835 [Desulfobacteraceae bacterium 4484_190.3]
MFWGRIFLGQNIQQRYQREVFCKKNAVFERRMIFLLIPGRFWKNPKGNNGTLLVNIVMEKLISSRNVFKPLVCFSSRLFVIDATVS